MTLIDSCVSSICLSQITTPDPLPYAGVAQSVERLAKMCLLKLTRERVHFIVVADAEGGAQCSIFTNYHIDSAAENEIFLEFQVDYLLRALRSAQNAVDVMMKLTKKNGVPLLSLIMSHSSRGGKRLELVQDIPVKVLSPNQMASLKEPVCPLPQPMLTFLARRSIS
ncbi:Hus1-like protein-domain-containing protein [Endogone sp. FLAS-F59071]|nr:Hus1-like protein-domain-containing protein [Endogone sp. FLAS-F59071]|eukprot:RUS19649.1 Hus1-like protein-domain-containing protein [Endogone sp. FLAS-F59071]